MDRGFRNDMMQKSQPGRAEVFDAAVARARVLALRDRHHDARRPGQEPRPQGPRPPRRRRLADITVYEDNPDREAMFATPVFVFKNGELIVRNGKVVKVVNGATHVARPEYDRGDREAAEGLLRRATTRCAWRTSALRDDEIIDGGRGEIIVQPTGGQRDVMKRQRRRDRRHVRRSLRHERHRRHHHRRHAAVGAPGGRHHDRLRHLGHRLRRRVRHRPRTVARRDARRAPRRARAAVRLLAGRAACRSSRTASASAC